MVLHVIGPPDLVAVGGEADEFAVLAEDEEPVAVNGRGDAA
ncbi:MAG: hypothetical protein WBC44_09925 [Planctomycetaceae bacterium]